MRNEDKYDETIQQHAKANRLDWLKIKAQIKQESAFDPNAVSRVGAQGLGQFMPRTWDEWGRGDDPFDAEANILATCRYMRWQLDRFNQDWEKALAAYNWGIGNVRKQVAKLGEGWKAGLPYETSHYIEQIKKFYVEYARSSPRAA